MPARNLRHVGGLALIGVFFLVGCNGPGSTSPGAPNQGVQTTDSATVQDGNQNSDGGTDGGSDNRDTVHLSSPLVYDPTTVGVPTMDDVIGSIQSQLDGACGPDQCGITVQSDAQCADPHADNCIVTTVTPHLPARIEPGSTITVGGSDAPLFGGGTTTGNTDTSQDDAVPSTNAGG